MKEAILKEFDKLYEERLTPKLHYDLKEFIGFMFDKALQEYGKEEHKQGRLKELAILKAHIEQQILRKTINTSSVLEYIEAAKEHINKTLNKN